MTHLPIHPTLRHPRTGDPLRAIGIGRRGPIWPAIGASDDPPADPQPVPPADPTAPPADPPKPDDKPLGPGGEKALREERERVKALQKQINELAPLKQIAELLGGKPTGDGKTDLEQLTERLGKHESDLAAEKMERWRAEVRADKGLTAAQAARLVGSSKEDLLADADALIALFPAPSGPRTPAPDPSQGSRGNGPPDLEAQIKEAQAKGDWRTVLSLQNQKLANTK